MLTPAQAEALAAGLRAAQRPPVGATTPSPPAIPPGQVLARGVTAWHASLVDENTLLREQLTEAAEEVAKRDRFIAVLQTEGQMLRDRMALFEHAIAELQAPPPPVAEASTEAPADTAPTNGRRDKPWPPDPYPPATESGG